MLYLCVHLHNTVQLNYEKEITKYCLRADSCWPLTAETWVQSDISSCGIMDTVALGQAFCQMLEFSPVTVIPSMLHIHLLMSPMQCNLSN